jgi:hypothetical protein
MEDACPNMYKQDLASLSQQNKTHTVFVCGLEPWYKKPVVKSATDQNCCKPLTNNEEAEVKPRHYVYNFIFVDEKCHEVRRLHLEALAKDVAHSQNTTNMVHRHLLFLHHLYMIPQPFIILFRNILTSSVFFFL